MQSHVRTREPAVNQLHEELGLLLMIWSLSWEQCGENKPWIVCQAVAGDQAPTHSHTHSHYRGIYLSQDISMFCQVGGNPHSTGILHSRGLNRGP